MGKDFKSFQRKIYQAQHFTLSPHLKTSQFVTIASPKLVIYSPLAGFLDFAFPLLRQLLPPSAYSPLPSPFDVFNFYGGIIFLIFIIFI